MLLAVAIFAVSFHPIRHSSEVKPYSADLLVAMILMVPAFAWLRNPSRTSRLWRLAAVSPFALVMSYPSVFIAGAVGLGLMRAVWRSGRQAWIPFLGFGIAVLATTWLNFTFVANGQSQAVKAWMQSYWEQSFPPRTGVGPFLFWLAEKTTGSMLAYPGGGQNFGSTPTLLLMMLGAFVLWRGKTFADLTILVAPFGFTLLAAVLHRYPYGGEARTMQYLAPSICIMTGIGLDAILRAVSSWRMRERIVRLGMIGLAVVALVLAWNNIRQPYRMIYDQRVREFAREFWPSQVRDAEVACIRWDYGVIEQYYKKGILNDNTPYFLCNQMIYSPQRQHNGGPRRDRVTSERPLRCVLYHETSPNDPDVLAWLETMKTQYHLRERKPYDVTVSGPKERLRVERIYVYEFEPTKTLPE